MSRRATAALAAITALAFGVRLMWALSVDSELIRFLDMQYYFAAAANLTAGDGFTVRFIPEGGYIVGAGGEQATLFPPGYSLVLAGAFKLFETSLTVGKVVNVAFGAATIPVLFFAARRLYGPAPALIGSAMLAVYPAHVFWTSVLYSEIVFTFCFTLAITLIVHGGPRPSVAACLAFGLTVGLAAVVRTQALILIPAAIAFWVLARSDLKRLGLNVSAVLLAMLAIIAPISVWNSARADRALLVSENLAYNLRAGHSPTANGRYNQPPEFTLGKLGLGQWEVTRRATVYAIHHPREELELSARKVYFLLLSDSGVLALATTGGVKEIWGSDAMVRRLEAVADVSWYSVLLLALVALPLTFSTRDERLVPWLVLVAWVAIHIVFFGEPRYHIPLVPVLCALAGCAVSEFSRAMSSWIAGGDTV